MNVFNHRRQYPLGQGGFHAGTVEGDGSLRFTYVYDCGSTNGYIEARDREIERYLGESNRLLDVLYLSHLHADHVNGIPKLLHAHSGVQVDTIILPLLDPASRLIAFARSLTEGALPKSMDDTEESDFYRSFIASPGDALARFHPRQVVFVYSGRNGDGAPGSRGEPPPPSDLPSHDSTSGESWRFVGRGRIERLSDEPYEDTLSGEDAEIYPSLSDPDRFTTFGPKRLVQLSMPDTIGIGIGGDSSFDPWLLTHFVDPTVEEKRESFLLRLAKKLGLSYANLLSSLNSTSFLLSLVTTHDKELRNAYAHVASNLNTTSLSLFSGPNAGHTNLKISADIFFAGKVLRTGSQSTSSGRIGWLGTGDASLKTPSSVQAFAKHFGNLLDNVFTLMLPHHGSDHNFSRDLLVNVKPQLCIAAADRVGKWRHPGSNVIQAVCSFPSLMHVVTSATEAGVDERVVMTAT